MPTRKNSLLIEAERVTVEPKGPNLTVRISNPTEECLLRLLTEASKLLEGKRLRANTTEGR